MSMIIDGEKYISFKEVLERVNMSQASLYEKMRYNCFPKPFKPESRTYWKESEINEYLERTRSGGKE